MYHLSRGLTVLLLLAVLEIFRQSTHVHALVQHDLARAGLSDVPLSVFDVSPASLPAWFLWLATLALCFVCISSLCLRIVGRSLPAALYSGTISWLALFVATWLAFIAFGLASVQTAAIALLGAWIESVLISSVIIFWPWQPDQSPSNT